MANDIDLQAELARLKQENEALKQDAKKQKDLSLKISEKGGLSLYGLGRFPVTLYKSQWLKLIGFVDTIKAFIDTAGPELKDRET